MELVKQNILVVDDSRLNLQLLRDLLAGDYEIITTTSGEQALAIVLSHSVDLILLDVIMPGMDGYQVCEKLKNNPRTKNIPVIFVSALRDAEAETKGLESGAIDYIYKPFNSSIVKARVKNHLELKRYRDMLEKMSQVDGLTGLANRRYFNEYIDKEWRRALRTGNSLAVFLLDIDFFKKYNDFYGHLAGDDCLRLVGGALKDSIKRAGDFIARYGGEEFAAILPSTSLGDALLVARQVRKNVESLKIAHQMSKVSQYVTVSVGVAAVRIDMDMVPASLVDKADNALYQAKREGRNRVVLYRA